MPECNIIFSYLDYFLNCYWVDSTNCILEADMGQPSPISKLHNWTISFVGGVKSTLSRKEPPSRYSKIHLVYFRASEGKVLVV